MDDEVQQRFERIEAILERVTNNLADVTGTVNKLAERQDRFERQLNATRNLIHIGVRVMLDTDTKLKALMDSDVRLYGAAQQIADSVRQLAEAQRVTEQKLQALLDSLRKGGDGQQQA